MNLLFWRKKEEVTLSSTTYGIATSGNILHIVADCHGYSHALCGRLLIQLVEDRELFLFPQYFKCKLCLRINGKSESRIDRMDG